MPVFLADVVSRVAVLCAAFYDNMRKDAREVVFKILYSKLFVDYDEALFNDLCKEFSLTDSEVVFAKDLLKKIDDNIDMLDGVISELSENFKLERIYPTDRCALYIGLAEMTYSEDVPTIVAIDEALAICRKYSTKESLSYVNGIFAKYKTNLENR